MTRTFRLAEPSSTIKIVAMLWWGCRSLECLQSNALHEGREHHRPKERGNHKQGIRRAFHYRQDRDGAQNGTSDRDACDAETASPQPDAAMVFIKKATAGGASRHEWQLS